MGGCSGVIVAFGMVSHKLRFQGAMDIQMIKIITEGSCVFHRRPRNGKPPVHLRR